MLLGTCALDNNVTAPYTANVVEQCTQPPVESRPCEWLLPTHCAQEGVAEAAGPLRAVKENAASTKRGVAPLLIKRGGRGEGERVATHC